MSKLAEAIVQQKMYNITYHNLQEFCRICLTQLQAATKSVNSYNLHNTPQLALLLKIFVSLDVNKQPNKFPNSICEQCYKTVINYEQFRNVALRSEAALQRVVQEAAAKMQQEAKNGTTDCGDDQLLLPELLPVTIVKSELLIEETMLEDTDTLFNNDHETSQPLHISIKNEPIDQENTHLNDEASDIDEAELRLSNAMDEDGFTMDMSYLSSALGQTAINSGRFNTRSTNTTGRKLRRTLKCNHCDKQAYKLVYLEAHIRAVHEGYEKPFLCRKCTKSFTRYSQLHEHIRTSHPAELVEDALLAETELTCQLCQRKYSSKRALDQHLKRHAQIKEHICKHCGVAKVTRTELLVHLRTHQTNIEKFKCTLCPQLFNHKNAISRHIRVVHEGERRFKCDYCNKSFGTRNSKERHELLHSDERPFTCDVCQKKFTHIDRLTTHMRSHDKNNWRYECCYCGKRCISRQNLLNHERRHKGEKPHICNVCSKGFIRNEDLDNHKQTHCTDVLDDKDQV